MSARLPLALFVLCACSAPAASKPDGAAQRPRSEAVPVAPSRPALEHVSPAPRTPSKLPTMGCALADSQDLTEGTLALAAGEPSGHAVYTLSPDARTLARWSRAGSGRLVAGASVVLGEPVARAALLDGATTDFALVDMRGQLLQVSHASRGFSTPRTLATGVDRRFAPALARSGDVLLTAYVASPSEAGGAMRTLLITSRSPTPRDLTPPGHGGAAPTFVLGASPPVLVFLDARAGVSPLLEVPFDVDGEPGPAIVRTPVSQPYAPPALIAVAWSASEIEVVYSAIGRAAMTALGRIPLRRTAEPIALSPSRGYGPLAFAAARSGGTALFALEVPSAPPPTAPRGLALKRLTAGLVEEGPTLTDPAGAQRPSVASTPESGVFLLAYARGAMLQAATVACAPLP